jgi:hypothetical protein
MHPIIDGFIYLCEVRIVEYASLIKLLRSYTAFRFISKSLNLRFALTNKKTEAATSVPTLVPHRAVRPKRKPSKSAVESELDFLRSVYLVGN